MSGCERCGVVGAHTCHRINPYAVPLASTTRSQYDDALGRTLMARGAGETRPMVSADTLAAERTRADAAEAELARLTTERAAVYRQAAHDRELRVAAEEALTTAREERDAARAEAAGLRAAIAENDEEWTRNLDLADMRARERRRRYAAVEARTAEVEALCGDLMAVGLAETARLRAIVEAADELIAYDYAAEVESYSETTPGSHAAAQVRAADAYSALVRLRDAWREAQGAAATPPTVAAEAATGAALAGERTVAPSADPVAEWIAAEERAPMADRLALIAWQRLTCAEREDAARRAPGLVALRRSRGAS